MKWSKPKLTVGRVDAGMWKYMAIWHYEGGQDWHYGRTRASAVDALCLEVDRKQKRQRWWQGRTTRIPYHMGQPYLS